MDNNFDITLIYLSITLSLYLHHDYGHTVFAKYDDLMMLVTITCIP